jgi:hypothetical protein
MLPRGRGPSGSSALPSSGQLPPLFERARSLDRAARTITVSSESRCAACAAPSVRTIELATCGATDRATKRAAEVLPGGLKPMSAGS